jgi:heavy metal efflux system protein
MVHRLIEWAVDNPLIVLLLAVCLAGFGAYAFVNVNVEAYPDPAPAIIEVVAQYPGASAEEVERLVTIPLELTLAGMPGLTYTRTKSLAGLCHMRNQFEYGVDYYAARQEVINRLSQVSNLPTGVTPQISPFTPTGELVRYTVSNPRDGTGEPIYSLNDLKALQDWTLNHELIRIPRIAGVTGFGGTVKRYEILPSPGRLARYGITLTQFQNAITKSNSNLGAGFLAQGPVAVNVRGIGLFGRGLDPMLQAITLPPRYRLTPEVMRRLDEAGVPRTALHGLEPSLGRVFGGKDEFLAAISPALTREAPRRLTPAWMWWKLRGGADADKKGTERDLVTVLDRAAVPDPLTAARIMRLGDEERLEEIRDIVVTSTNNVPVRVRDLVEDISDIHVIADTSGEMAVKGVQVGYQPRLGRVGVSRPRGVNPSTGKMEWVDDDDMVQAIVLMRKNEATLLALEKVHEKIKEMNEKPGTMLPGTRIDLHFDLTGLLHVTTETVHENLLTGMVLVTIILLMFLSNVRSALIVAINIPLALLFAFSVLFLRGKSANLLSIGAVDFGIIVDSSVIMVENIYRHVSSGELAELPLRDRIVRACFEVEKPLFFATAIMVCAFLPLFTMRGPEGQIFGPMADTYAFALGGALILALTVAPVLCLIFFKHLKPTPDNWLVRYLKRSYLRQLDTCLNHRFATLSLFITLAVVTGVAMIHLGREFMPELEEGNLYVRGTFPVNISLDQVSLRATAAREIMRSYPEVKLVASQVGRPDDGTDPSGFYNAEFSIPLYPDTQWPATVPNRWAIADISAPSWLPSKKWLPRWLFWFDVEPAWNTLFQPLRPRTKQELIKAMNDDLDQKIVGVAWNFSQYIRDNVMESLSGVKGDNSVKIIGPDLNTLEETASRVRAKLEEKDEKGSPLIPGVENVSVFRISGQPNLEFTVDRDACKRWAVSVGDVENAIQVAVGGSAFTRMIEGEKQFDITLKWPDRLRGNEQAILNIPVDAIGNVVTQSSQPSVSSTPTTGAAIGISPTGTSLTPPTNTGSMFGGTFNNTAATPRLLLKQLVVPTDPDGKPNPKGSFLRIGASTICREQGKRLIAVGFSVRGRDLAGTVAQAQEEVSRLVPVGYRTEWSGEFQEMQEAEERLMMIVPLSLGAILILLYLSFRNWLDASVVLSNVLALSLGGVWALLLTGLNFSISAAVGFISIFGVAIMDGLLLVSYFNHLRAEGHSVRQAILEGAEKRVRPVMMTALTAIFGLLPAAFSTRIGSQTQRPLAIVVVGGMISTLFLTRYLMPVLYSFYGHREPPSGSGGMAH